jgi:hypothetical protein
MEFSIILSNYWRASIALPDFLSDILSNTGRATSISQYKTKKLSSSISPSSSGGLEGGSQVTPSLRDGCHNPNLFFVKKNFLDRSDACFLI